MSEKITRKPENDSSESREKFDKASSERLKEVSEQREKNAATAKHEHKDQIDQILRKIEKSSKSSEEISKSQENESETDENDFVGTGVKKQAYKQTIARVRKQLKPYQRPISKVIHNESIEKISEVGANTIARPSGLLVGGIASFITSVLVLAAARYFGYEYNYFIGLASFAGGFAIGIFGEMLLKTFRKT